jgi:hypothetical protein
VDSAGDDPIETAWRELLTTWGDEAAHKRFISLASSLKRLGDAGRHYREVRDAPDSLSTYRDLPNRREIATKRIDEILGVAMLTMAAVKTLPPDKKHPKLVMIAAGICLAMIVFAAWSFMRMR